MKNLIIICLVIISCVFFALFLRANRFVTIAITRQDAPESIEVEESPQTTKAQGSGPCKPREQMKPIGAAVSGDTAALLLRVERAWQNDTGLFLKAILGQENTPMRNPDNPWNFQPDFIEDVRIYSGNTKEDFKKLNLANPDVAAMLIVTYGTRHQARDTHHMAAMFRKGPTGYRQAVAQSYAVRVCNLIEFDLRKGE